MQQHLVQQHLVQQHLVLPLVLVLVLLAQQVLPLVLGLQQARRLQVQQQL